MPSPLALFINFVAAPGCASPRLLPALLPALGQVLPRGPTADWWSSKVNLVQRSFFCSVMCNYPRLKWRSVDFGHLIVCCWVINRSSVNTRANKWFNTQPECMIKVLLCSLWVNLGFSSPLISLMYLLKAWIWPVCMCEGVVDILQDCCTLRCFVWLTAENSEVIVVQRNHQQHQYCSASVPVQSCWD